MNYPCLYKATVFYYDGEAQSDVTETMHGILYADSFADAARQVESYYGKDLISVETELFEDGLIEIPEAEVATIRKILEGTY